MWSTGPKETVKEKKAVHQAKPSRNSWDRPSASEVKASTYLIRSNQAAGAAKLIDEVAKRLKEQNGVPWWPREPIIKVADGAGDGMARDGGQMDWSKDGL
jgi:hypothetical protein